jgi:hypothetical protein
VDQGHGSKREAELTGTRLDIRSRREVVAARCVAFWPIPDLFVTG